jgi:hypothetical protein
MSAATIVLETTEFFSGHKISMARSGYAALFFVITASGIIILKIDQYGGTRGLALKKTTFKMWRIFFFARSGTWLLSSLSAFNIGQQIFGTQRQPSRTSVDQYPHGLTVRFTKDVNSKNLSERIQSLR